MKSPENFPPTPPPSPQSQSPRRASTAGSARDALEAIHVLVVDSDIKTLALVQKAAEAITTTSMGVSASAKKALAIAPPAQIRQATSLDAAQAEMLRKPADLLLVNLQINDEGGLDLIRNLKRRYPRTEILALSRSRKSDLCLDAWRAGASDMLLAPWQPEELLRALNDLNARRLAAVQVIHRNQRLRSVCRRLNKARHEISQQVDLLCNDLVRAYQEMAQQLNVTQTATDYAQALNGELDVEGILRRTMEWVLRKLGPVNAAIYLPSGDEHFALGAYLNLDTQADAPLIEVLGRTIVQHTRSAGGGAGGPGGGGLPLSIEEDEVLEDLFGQDAEALVGRQWLAVGCHTPRECLAVLLVFRAKSAGTPPMTSTKGLLEAIAPVLGERIEQALGLYHRLHPFPEDDVNPEGKEGLDR